MCFRYNVKDSITLTEDRSARHFWQISESIERTIITSQDENFILKTLTCGKEAHEGSLLFTDSTLQQLAMSEAFQAVCSHLAARKPRDYNRNAVKYYENRSRKLTSPEDVALSPVQTMQLEKARRFIKSLGFADTL
jgi:hypothetical protein